MAPLADIRQFTVLVLAVAASAAAQPIDEIVNGHSGGVNLTDTRNEGVETTAVDPTGFYAEDESSSGEEGTVVPTLGPNAFWGIDKEPYRTVLFYVLISCSVLLAGTLVLLCISMCYARFRGAQSQRRAEQTIQASSLPSKGSMRDRLAQKPAPASAKKKVSHV